MKRKLTGYGAVMVSIKDRYAAALTKAEQVLGSEKRAREWMREPAMFLDGQLPAELVRTAEGAALVDTYLDQIEHGVYP